MHFLRYLAIALVVASLGPGILQAADADDQPPELLIGYTEFRTNLPGGRYVNQATFRAVVVKADGTGRRVLAEELTREKNSWTQFAGWSPDGKTAVFSRAWMSDENGKWEEEHKTFRYPKGGFSCDGYLFDQATAKATNVTAVDRISHANEYLQYWPDEKTLSFSAHIDGVSRSYLMDLDGKNKRELIRKTPKLVHGMSLSPDGKRGAYEDSAYRLFLADGDGSNAKHVETGQRFNFLPEWAPDGPGCCSCPANTTTATRTWSRRTARA